MKKSIIGILIILILIGILLYLRKRSMDKFNPEGQNIGRPNPAIPLIDEDYCLRNWCCDDSISNIFNWKMYACSNCRGLIGTYTQSDFQKQVYEGYGVRATCRNGKGI